MWCIFPFFLSVFCYNILTQIKCALKVKQKKLTNLIFKMSFKQHICTRCVNQQSTILLWIGLIVWTILKAQILTILLWIGLIAWTILKAQSFIIVDWPYYLIGPLVLLLVIFHFSKFHFQVYEWGLKYINKAPFTLWWGIVTIWRCWELSKHIKGYPMKKFKSFMCGPKLPSVM